MKLKEFDYHLPKNLIAQKPKEPRDHSRLLVYDKKAGETEHKKFYNIVDYLEKGDVLVLNNSKVFPARLIGKKKSTGGKIEVFLLHKIRGNSWQCLLGGRARENQIIEFEKNLECKIIKNNNNGTWEVKFDLSGKKLMDAVEKIGLTPLPPYIKRSFDFAQDKQNYQTIYADEKKVGSVAAPTAGFHFTPGLIKKLKKKGVEFEYITLHVGLGTFAPVKVDNIKKHKMHAEYVEIKKQVFDRIMKARREGRRIIGVGTTSVRALESFKKNKLKFFTDIFIYPGYKFKIIDAMITNFHLPKSTLLMLVSAFACAEQSRCTGKKNIDKVYKEAIKKKYRFYSYGDAMFIK